MGVLKEVQDFWHSLPKFSLEKIIIYSILLIIVAFMLLVFCKAVAGEHIKLFGFEINEKETNVKNGTIKKLLPIKKDTVKVYLPTVSHLRSGKNRTDYFGQIKVNVPASSITKSKMAAKDTLTKEVYTITAPVSQSAVGHGASVTNNNYGVKQRYLSDADKQYIKSRLIRKDIDITIMSERDKESEEFSTQIYNFLKEGGYVNVRFQIYMPQFPKRGQSESIKVDTNKNYVSINVPPLYNVH